MIKNYKKYLKEQKKEREKYLQSLTYEESARITEGLVSSSLIYKLNFSKDDNPMSLKHYLNFLKKCKKKSQRIL